MDRPDCPKCSLSEVETERRTPVHLFGSYFRSSDRKWIRRFRCSKCEKCFSEATFDDCYWQRKRQFNSPVLSLLVSGVSQRRGALLLKLNRKTIARKLVFLGGLAKIALQESNLNLPKVQCMEFDDLETFEHTKCKPLSVTMAMEFRTRRVLGFEVSRMPAKGLLAKKALKKYGYRPDERAAARAKLFSDIQPMIAIGAVIKSDQSPHYPQDVAKYFPESEHRTFKGRKGAITGQGELKKVGFDPLFSLNHTFAKLRADINRLFRKTWCTTKRPDRLAHHIAIMVVTHNQMLAGK